MSFEIIAINKIITEIVEKLFKYNYTTISLITVSFIVAIIALASLGFFNVTNVILVVGLYISAITTFTQRERFHLAKVESEISSLLPYRLEIIKELAIIFEDNVYYDDEHNPVPIVDELYQKHSSMVAMCFGDRAENLFDLIKSDEKRVINLSNREDNDENEKLFTEVHTRYLNNKSELYRIFYKSIRVRDNL